MSTRTPELKAAILKMAGKEEFYGYEIHKKLEQKNINIGIGRLYSILSDMKDEGLLRDRWENSQSGPKRRVYRIEKKGDAARQRILMEAIKTVHEFYIEYLLNLPPELSAFNIIGDLIVEKLSDNVNIAYAASSFSGPVRKLMANIKDKVPDGNLYAIHPRRNGTKLEIDDVSILDGTLEDVPMKENYLDLLVITGNINDNCLDSCLREWQRVLSPNGTLAIITPTALLTQYNDPLGIGEFIEQKEHPRIDDSDTLSFEKLTNEMKKCFETVEVDEIVHITVLRGSNPIK